MNFLSVIADNSTAIYAVCFPGLVISAGYVVWKTGLFAGSSSAPATRPSQRRPVPPTPSAKPKSLEAGQAEHQARGEAKTVKMPAGPRDERKIDTDRMPVTAASTDDAAKDDLFSGLGEPAARSRTGDTSNIRKAERLEELGLHVHDKEAYEARNRLEDDDSKTEVVPVQADPAATDPKRAETQAAEPKTQAPRSQTQELDDILSRIDKVLADNPVMATTTIGSGSDAQRAATQPPTETVEKDKKKTEIEPDGQQKLF